MQGSPVRRTAVWVPMPNLLTKDNLIQHIQACWQDESGQDLIEYTLLMAFVALCSATLFINTGSSVSKIWSSTNSTLSTAALKAAS